MKNAKPLRLAFTLLEVVLTLAMSVVLMALIGAAIQFYARDMTLRDLEIRRTVLAVAVMQMIEDDLRATVHPQPVDTTPMAELLAASGSEDSAGDVSDGEDLTAAGLESETESVDDLAADELQSGVAVLKTPGLIGNQNHIQLDLSRLPRLEEYVAMFDETISDINDIPSDLKTVAYFVQPAGLGVEDTLDALNPTTLTANTLSASSGSLPTGGLLRRSLDHAATAEAAENGNLTLLNQTGAVLAPEITAIEFSYWDGDLWLTQWSSDEYAELPLAIRVTLSMTDSVARISNRLAARTGTDEVRTFTHIVRLPMARASEEEEQEQNEETLGIQP